MQLGKLGAWAFLEGMSAQEIVAFAQGLEEAGYAALWMPEALGRNALVTSSWLLANTRKLVIATGIANIYARDAMAMAAAQNGLAEQSGGRFLLGLGVSHAPLVADLRGHDYGRPVATMRAYLDAMAQSPYVAPKPAERPLTLLAALGPKMLELARDKADGAHPYNVTPEHTAEARRILGPGKLLCVEQMFVAETDPARARAIARAGLAPYMALPNYSNNWARLGFVEADWADGGTDRLIDAIVAWGDDDAIAARVKEHWAAGADHVCIQQLTENDAAPDLAVFRRLAAKLG
jgi:probable F420-dependent oxidoreductase